MMSLDSKLLKKFLERVGQKLKGEWLLVGGTLLPAVGLDIRSTMDIDIVGLGKEERSESLELMKIAEHLGLSVESINQAATIYVDKVGYKKTDLIILHKGKSAKVYRPSLELYWKLKVYRLTESDFIDCKHYLGYCKGQKDNMDFKSIRLALKKAENVATSSEKLSRIKDLSQLTR